jgi:hypothetical protein
MTYTGNIRHNSQSFGIDHPIPVKVKRERVLFLCDQCFIPGEELTMGCYSESRPCDVCGEKLNCHVRKYHFLWNDQYESRK